MAVFNAVIFTELNMISVFHKTLQNQKETDFRLRFKTNEKNNPKIDLKTTTTTTTKVKNVPQPLLNKTKQRVLTPT